MLSSSLVSLLALVSLAVADPIHVPLRRRNVDNAFSSDRIAAQADRVRDRYGFRRPSAAVGRRAGQTVGIQTINQVSIALGSSRYHDAASMLGVCGAHGSECHRHRCGQRARRSDCACTASEWHGPKIESAARCETSVRPEYAPKVQERKNILRLALSSLVTTAASCCLAAPKRHPKTWRSACALSCVIGPPDKHPNAYSDFLESGLVLPRRHYRRHTQSDV